MNRVVGAVWSGMLVVTAVGVVPVVVNQLRRLLAAANNIERYSAEILTSGVGIAGNTANVAALKDTLAVAPQLLAGAGSIKGHAAAIERALGAGSGGDGGEVGTGTGPGVGVNAGTGATDARSPDAGPAGEEIRS